MVDPFTSKCPAVWQKNVIIDALCCTLLQVCTVLAWAALPWLGIPGIGGNVRRLIVLQLPMR